MYTSDSDDDTLARALVVLLSTQDDADYAFKVFDKTILAHKYIVAVNAPKSQLLVGETETIIPDTLLPNPEIFEILLHYIYAHGTLSPSSTDPFSAHVLF